MSPDPIKVTLDNSEVVALELLSERLQLAFEFSNRLIGLVESGGELFRIKQGVTSGASVALFLEPSDGLRDLLAAIRASELEFLLVEKSIAHGSDAGSAEGEVKS